MEAMSNLKKSMIIISVVFLLFVPSFCSIASSSSSGPIVGSYDDYERKVKRGTKTTFNWTIERVENEDFTVRIETEGLSDLEKKIEPSPYLVLDEKNPTRVVGLTVEMPMFPDSKMVKGDVIFSFYQNGTIQKEVKKDINIEVSGLPDEENANSIVGGYQNPLPAPLNKPIGAFFLNLAIWSCIGIGLFFAVTLILSRLTKKTKTNLDNLVIKMVRRPLLIFILLYGFIHSILRLELGLQIRATLYQFYSILVVIIGVYVAYQIFDGILDEISFRRGGKAGPFGKVLKPIFEKIGIIVIILGGMILGLNIIGVEVTALLAGAGVLGLVIAFAAQDTLSNFFSGMHLLLDRPFTMGDVLELESGEYCRVEKVGMRSTKLYDLRDHELIVLPNNSIANQKIKNLAEPDKKMRVAVDVGVAYGSDTKKVRDILYDVVENHENTVIDEEFEPVVRFKEFGDSSLNFTVRFWVEDFMDQWDITSDIRNRIDDEFKEAKVTIPFPQRTIWMKSDEE